MADKRASTGRLTLPIQTGIDDGIRELVERLQPDAVRNSDGTALPELVNELATKVYSTYFVGRGDNVWAKEHPDHLTRIHLMSERVTAVRDGELNIDLMDQWFADQIKPDVDCDITKHWQVIDRTTGETVPPESWELVADDTVKVRDAKAGHAYTVGFLAVQLWDPTQMYNYLTNGWEDDPAREKEMPFDVRHPGTWEHVRTGLDRWLGEHPEVDVVRFTTFFYHFTLVYGADAKERFVDWFGYGASVSIPALEAFEAEKGYALTPEDFIDEGYYNSPFRTPTPAFRDWIDFQHRFVTSKVKSLVEQVHAAGKEAIMFLGDNWIGTEPYGPHFAETGLDAVVGSVGSGATCRMISDIPGVRYTEGRFLPYFFPDVFHPDGDPVSEANESWLTARRAIVRSPLDRIGYGGYLSLALEHPDFIDRMEEIVDEFRAIHDRSGGTRPATEPVTVAILNAWGKLRSWQTHMVAHALHYRQAYSYLGVLEALAGLPIDVEFIDFDQVRDGVPEHIGVIVNAGAMGTAFSGGEAWADPEITSSINQFVLNGGGLIGVGDPAGHPMGGRTFQLSDLLGVDRELGWGLSTNRRFQLTERHFITADLDNFDAGEGTPDVVPVAEDVEILRGADGVVEMAARSAGAGRSVYFAGLPYSHDNARLLHRAIVWASKRDEAWGPWISADPRVEVARYPEQRLTLMFNNDLEPVATTVTDDQGQVFAATLAAGAHMWINDAAFEKGEATT